MDELNGEIVCAVEKWCKLIAGLSSGQRAALAETPLRSMLQIPSLKMRTLLIRYMVEIFDPSKGRFIVQDLVGEVSLGAVDVECILALENHGLSAEGILGEEGEDVKDRVPPQFLSKTTGNIVIDDLIVDITKNKICRRRFPSESCPRVAWNSSCSHVEQDCTKAILRIGGRCEAYIQD